MCHCVDANCPLREASSQRIPKLTVKVRHSTAQQRNTFLISAALISTSPGIQWLICQWWGREPHTVDVDDSVYIYSGGERKEWDGRRLKYKKVLQCNILYSISSLDPSIINTWRIGDWVTSHSFSLLSQNLMKHKLCIFCFRPESTACTSCRRHYLASRGRKMHSSERADISLKHHSYARVHVLC